jgi:hypothetical protein
MFNAKRQGGNSYQFFDRKMHDEMVRNPFLKKI